MALEVGARGYLHEDMTAQTLVMALELVLRGETVLPSVAANLLAGTPPQKARLLLLRPPGALEPTFPLLQPRRSGEMIRGFRRGKLRFCKLLLMAYQTR